MSAEVLKFLNEAQFWLWLTLILLQHVLGPYLNETVLGLDGNSRKQSETVGKSWTNSTNEFVEPAAYPGSNSKCETEAEWVQ